MAVIGLIFKMDGEDVSTFKDFKTHKKKIHDISGILGAIETLYIMILHACNEKYNNTLWHIIHSLWLG